MAPDHRDELDRRIFGRDDTPLDEKDEILGLLGDRIEQHVHALSQPGSDRYQVMYVEAAVAILYHLSLHVHNNVTRPTDVMLWRFHTLEYFDSESKARGDAETWKDWRSDLEKNFDRLISLLNEK